MVYRCVRFIEPQNQSFNKWPRRRKSLPLPHRLVDLTITMAIPTTTITRTIMTTVTTVIATIMTATDMTTTVMATTTASWIAAGAGFAVLWLTLLGTLAWVAHQRKQRARVDETNQAIAGLAEVVQSNDRKIRLLKRVIRTRAVVGGRRRRQGRRAA